MRPKLLLPQLCSITYGMCKKSLTYEPCPSAASPAPRPSAGEPPELVAPLLAPEPARPPVLHGEPAGVRRRDAGLEDGLGGGQVVVAARRGEGGVPAGARTCKYSFFYLHEQKNDFVNKLHSASKVGLLFTCGEADRS